MTSLSLVGFFMLANGVFSVFAGLIVKREAIGQGGWCKAYGSLYIISNKDCTCFRQEDISTGNYDYLKCPWMTVFSTDTCTCDWKQRVQCSQPSSRDVCSKAEEHAVTTPGPAPDLEKLSEATGRFNAVLMSLLMSGANKSRNVVISPFSIHTVLAMVYEGALGRTRSEMNDAMYYGIVPDLKLSYNELLLELNSPSNTTILTANRIYHQQTFTFLSSYLQVVRDYYLSDVVPSDFITKPDIVRQEINKWVKQQTAGFIKDLLPPRSITPLTAMVLVNALYFKGFWEKPFHPNNTTAQDFYIEQNQLVTVDMMAQVQMYKYVSTKDYQAVLLPYQGGHLAMSIILPRDFAALERLSQAFTYDVINNIQKALAAQEEEPVKLFLPKFKVEAKYDLVQTLSAMGMPTLFSSTADLSGMNGRGGLFVSKVIHQAVVDVSEEGTEGAAATAVVVVRGRLPPEMKVNRPFFFLISVVKTNHILFAGRISRP